MIQPLSHKSFFGDGTFDEIGKVIAIDEDLVQPKINFLTTTSSGCGNYYYALKEKVQVGDIVYFDSWLAAKYPNEESENKEDYYWLVPWKDIRAIKDVPNEIPEQRVPEGDSAQVPANTTTAEGVA